MPRASEARVITFVRRLSAKQKRSDFYYPLSGYGVCRRLQRKLLDSEPLNAAQLGFRFYRKQL